MDEWSKSNNSQITQLLEWARAIQETQQTTNSISVEDFRELCLSSEPVPRPVMPLTYSKQHVDKLLAQIVEQDVELTELRKSYLANRQLIRNSAHEAALKELGECDVIEWSDENKIVMNRDLWHKSMDRIRKIDRENFILRSCCGFVIGFQIMMLLLKFLP